VAVEVAVASATVAAFRALAAAVLSKQHLDATMAKGLLLFEVVRKAPEMDYVEAVASEVAAAAIAVLGTIDWQAEVAKGSSLIALLERFA
jgi:hypothetical protein